MAAKDDKKDPKSPANQPGFDPKPVQLGGESLIERLIPHMKKVAIALAVAAAILTVIFTFRHFKERAREKTTDELAAVLDVGSREVRTPGAEPDPKAKQPTFASNDERANAVAVALANARSAPGTYRASVLLQAGKLDDAIAQYRKLQAGTDLDAVLAREGLGIALETKATQQKDPVARQKALEEALAVFHTMQPDEAGPRHGYALYHQGRMLALLGKPAEAKAVFEKAKLVGKDDKLVQLIDERIAMLGAS